MLLVKTKIAPSNIHGVGLVADQFIPKDTVIWVHNDAIDRVYLKQGLDFLPAQARETILLYGWREGIYYVYPGDNARFTNYSSDPNCGPGVDGTSVALRDIIPGEEIVEDYGLFDDDFALYAHELTI